MFTKTPRYGAIALGLPDVKQNVPLHFHSDTFFETGH